MFLLYQAYLNFLQVIDVGPSELNAVLGAQGYFL